ncbi:MAG: hypothetical protein ACFFDS_03700 [Candidatus Thorarchaeota archaeon]
MIFFPKDEDYFPSITKTAAILTYILSVIGLSLGVILLILTWNTELFVEPEPDDLTNLGPFMKFVGIVFLIIAVISIIVNIIFINRRLIGWFSLSGIYLAGTILTIYMIYRGIQVMIKYSIFSVPIHLLLVLALGIIGLYTLFHKNTIGFFSKKEVKVAAKE